MGIKVINREGHEQVYALLVDVLGNIAKLDPHWGCLVTEDTSHKNIHDGKSFFVDYLWGEGNNVADNASADILIQTGAKVLHMIYTVNVGGASELFLYEGATFSAAGTAVVAYNKNRASLNKTSATITHTPTITGTGTSLSSSAVPGGTKDAGSGGQSGSFDREIDLAANTAYLVRVTNRSGGVQPISISLEWYENV